MVLSILPVLCLNALAGWALVSHGQHDEHGLHVHAQRHAESLLSDHHSHRHCHPHTGADAPGDDDEPEGVRVELPAQKPMPSKGETPRLAALALPVAILTVEPASGSCCEAAPPSSGERNRPCRTTDRLLRTSCALLL